MLFIIIALTVFITQSVFTHWWLIVIDSFIAAILFAKSGWGAFLSGFAAVALVWFGQAYYLNYRNGGILLEKISNIFSLSPNMIIVVTTVLFGIVAGFAALSRYSIRALFKRKE